MNYLELFAALLGIISVWYARKENILVFPFGIANVLIYVYICLDARLYANAGINAIYFLSNTYGWFMWSRTNENDERLQITRNTKKQNWISWVSVAIIYVLVLYLLRWVNRADVGYIQSYVPYVDSFNVAFFLVATILMALKKLENWQFWIIGNILSIPIYASQGLYFTSGQYTAFLILAVLGYTEWKKKITN